MSADQIVSLIAVIGSLVLATRALRSKRLGSRKTAQMAGIWAVIIIALAFVLQRFAA